MKKMILAGMMLVSVGAQAEITTTTLKELSCRGATLEMKLQVELDGFTGAMPTVAWQVRDNETLKYSEFMGYLFSDQGLKEFSSTDLGSDVKVSRSVAVVQFGDKEETLFCR